MKTIVTVLVAAAFIVCPSSPAVTLVSGPTLTRARNAPLAGLLQLSTDIDSRVSVVVSDGSKTWERDFFDYGKTHSLPLVGFKPGQTNQVQVTIHDSMRNSVVVAPPFEFVTGKLPADVPRPKVLKSDPGRMEPGYTLSIIEDNATGTDYLMIVDSAGEVVWYKTWTGNRIGLDIRQLPNGDLFIKEAEPLNRFLELNLLGETVQTWSAPAGHPLNLHDGFPTDHGTILYLSNASRTVTNFPSSATDPAAPRRTVKVDDNPVIEISATTSELLNSWSPLDLLDPQRVTYLTFQSTSDFGVDNEHANAVIEDPRDDSLIVSFRNQNAVVKFTRSGQLKWILGPPSNWTTNFQPYLFTPEGTPFNWNYGQHAPEITPVGTLLLYNNGINRASPFDPPLADKDNHSGAVEYRLDETNRVVSQVWDSSQPDHDRLFTPIVGDADWLPLRRNVLVTYGNVTYVNGVHPSANSPDATMVRIIEYTHEPAPEVVFDLSFFDANNKSASYQGYLCYRSERIHDLYPHPIAPVSDLVINHEAQRLMLRFSGDPTHTFFIQSSDDLANWATIGSPVTGSANGEFAFDQDINTLALATRYYRVVTR